MNKQYIPGVIVVEGTHDASKISSLFNTTFVITNGYEIPKEEIKFLQALPKGVQVIILTDNDEAGEIIRKRLNDIIENPINITIKAPESKKKKGVAECDIRDIKQALDNYVAEEEKNDDLDFFLLDLSGRKNAKENRNKIINKFNLGLCSTTNMKKRIKLLGINKEEIIKTIKYDTSK